MPYLICILNVIYLYKYIYLHVPPVYLVPVELGEGIGSPRTSIINGQDGTWVLGTGLRVPARAASALKHGALFLVPVISI